MNKNYSKGVFLNIFSVNKDDWKRQINFINSLPKVDHIEICLEERLKLSDLKYLKSLLKGRKIIIHGPFIHLSLISPHKEIREATIKRYLETFKVAKALDAGLITFHAGTKSKFSPEKKAKDLLIKNLKRIKKYYKGNIAFSIENLPPQNVGGVQKHCPSSLKDLSYFKKAVPWLNFTVDIGHAFQGGENLGKIILFLKKHKDSVSDIHLHDAIIRGEAHLCLGLGELDFKEFFRILDKIGYRGYVSLETISKEDTKKSWGKIYKL